MALKTSTPPRKRVSWAVRPLKLGLVRRKSPHETGQLRGRYSPKRHVSAIPVRFFQKCEILLSDNGQLHCISKFFAPQMI